MHPESHTSLPPLGPGTLSTGARGKGEHTEESLGRADIGGDEHLEPTQPGDPDHGTSVRWLLAMFTDWSLFFGKISVLRFETLFQVAVTGRDSVCLALASLGSES